MLISIPEYYRRYINSKVDLAETPKVCCPFHDEDTPSFSYSATRDVWRCFGACHKGGDVIALHQANYHLRTREEAEKSLYKLLGIKKEVPSLIMSKVEVDAKEVEEHIRKAKAITIAQTPEQWLELDYIMSMCNYNNKQLDEFINKER